MAEETDFERKMGGGRHSDDDTEVFKSKNLKAERRRREKLSSRLLELRALVPKITNVILNFLLVRNMSFFFLMKFKVRDLSLQMTKPTIITDAISYIHELKSRVQELSDQILAMEATINEHEQLLERSEVDVAQEMKNWGIEVILILNSYSKVSVCVLYCSCHKFK